MPCELAYFMDVVVATCTENLSSASVLVAIKSVNAGFPSTMHL